MKEHFRSENPSGDFKSMCRHTSKGAWTFSDRDHGWQVSDCTAEALKVINEKKKLAIISPRFMPQT